MKRAAVDVPGVVLAICRRLHAVGFQCYIVGGAIRDALLGRRVSDWDIATDALPEVVMQLFPKVAPTGLDYGTVTVVSGKTSVEVTTFRRDAEYVDGRRPSRVYFTGDIREDLRRRDFTINAIAYDPVNQRFVDPFRGRWDIRRRRLRTVGNPAERFREDGLRVMRLLRFVSVLGFKPEKKTVTAVDPHLLRPVSRERIRIELEKLLLGSNLRPALRLMHGSGVLQEVLPELAEGEGVIQGDMHRYDVLQHSLEAAACIRPELHLKLAALLHDVAKPRCLIRDEKGIHFYGHEKAGSEMAKEILQRLRFPVRLQEAVSHLIRWHMFSLHGFSSDRAVRRLIARVGREYVDDLLELRRADIAAAAVDMHQALEAWQRLRRRVDSTLASAQALTVHDLAVNGRDIMQVLDLKPGPLVGKVLDDLLEQVLDDPGLNDRDTLLQLARKRWAGHTRT